MLDIGGGSTECIIGKDHDVYTLASLPIGCVNFQRRFFSDKKITKKAFTNAINAAKNEISSIVKRFSKIGWDTCIGTSGTIKSVYNIINIESDKPHQINLKELYALQKQLVGMQTFDQIQLVGLKENRRNIICSGLAILIALFESLEIDALTFCDYSLREGVLSEQLDLIHYDDVRQRSVDSLSTRFSVDEKQSVQVIETALALYKCCKKDWGLNKIHYLNLLKWSAQLHEIGSDINPSGYQKHGEYIITHADIAGFNKEDQQALAWLISNHRKKIRLPQNIQFNSLKQKPLLRIVTILRLSVLLNQQRQLTDEATLNAFIKKDQITIELAKDWLDKRPFIVAALLTEQQILSAIGIELLIEAI